MNIVFYIRGLFHENTLKSHSDIDNALYFSLFKKIYNLDIQQYRREVNEIQQLNLNRIGCRVIVNSNLHITDKEKLPFPYQMIPKHTIEQLMGLDDDTIVIPLDDDDWISPDIINYPFDTDALNIWGTGRTVNREPYFTRVPICKPLSFDTDWQLPVNHQACRDLLSNCYGIPAKFIKVVINNTDVSDLNLRLKYILHRHSRVRATIREHKIINKENIQDTYLSVYVRHFGNMTELKQWSTLDEDIDKIKSFVSNKIIATNRSDMDNCNLWFADYQKQLIDLNNRVLSNMLS
jgi:hypothetical protein